MWTWLPGAVGPVVAGVLAPTGAILAGEPVLAFRYAASYLARADRVSLFLPELPLADEVFDPTDPRGRRDLLALAGCLRDGVPDAWGRRAINLDVGSDPDAYLTETTYLLASGSDRIGALDFQASPTEYVPRGEQATLEQLMDAAALVEAGTRLPPELAAAVAHATSIGGARPKALLVDGGRHLIAKFSSSTDDRPAVKAEAVGMLLAARCGVDVAPVRVVETGGKDVLLVERFDRAVAPDGVTRRGMVSMLTILGASENGARYASHAGIAQAVRSDPLWADVPGTLRELYLRLVVNVVVGNTDDHLRNTAAFWDGRHLTLTPAYDVAPQRRSTQPASQAIAITADGQRASQLRLCRQVAPEFHLSAQEVDDVIDRVLTTVTDAWDEVCDQATLTRDERGALWGREIGNPYLHYDEA